MSSSESSLLSEHPGVISNIHVPVHNCYNGRGSDTSFGLCRILPICGTHKLTQANMHMHENVYKQINKSFFFKKKRRITVFSRFAQCCLVSKQLLIPLRVQKKSITWSGAMRGFLEAVFYGRLRLSTLCLQDTSSSETRGTFVFTGGLSDTVLHWRESHPSIYSQYLISACQQCNTLEVKPTDRCPSAVSYLIIVPQVVLHNIVHQIHPIVLGFKEKLK